jgi:hypothetical protein
MLQNSGKWQQNIPIMHLPRFDQCLIPLVIWAPRLNPERSRWIATCGIVKLLPLAMADAVSLFRPVGKAFVGFVRRHHGGVEKSGARKIVYGLPVIVDRGHGITVDG